MGLQLYHGVTRSPGGGGRRSAVALGDPVRLVVAPGIGARLVMRLDPRGVVVVVARNPFVGDVALWDPGVVPVAGDDAALRRDEVDRLRDDDHRRNRANVVRLPADVRFLGVVNVALGRRIVMDVPQRDLAALGGSRHVGRLGADRDSGNQHCEHETDHDTHADSFPLLYTLYG